ncbi:MAG TPA: LamG domain-containing protein, partial [Acidimicrobiia bacterium]|nr:LamG domain-containing protein [Acidimicrobiia bacterium]
VSETLSGLSPNTLYHYRLVATSPEGPTNGADKTFTTAPAPIAAYSFDEGSGTTLNDSAANHDGTISGASWSTEGKYGSALDFDGTNDLVSIADASDLDLTGSFTLQAWVRPGSDFTPNRAVIVKGQAPGGDITGYSLSAQMTSAKPQGGVAKANSFKSVVGPEALKADTWTHLTVTSDTTTLRLYVNGELKASAPAIAAGATNGPLEIGHGAYGLGYFDGLIDDVRIYEERLSQAQIEADRDEPVAPAPIAAYSFDEGSGTTLNDSAANHDGAITGATWTTAGKYGSALDFDGADDLVSVADADDLDLTKNFTLEAWARPDTLANWKTVLSKGESPGGSASGYILMSRSNGGYPEGVVGDSGTLKGVTGTSALPAGSWSHLALTSDGTDLRLYVGGQLVATAPAIAAKPTVANLEIGHTTTLTAYYFDGLIDEVRIYDRTLSQSQIQADRDTPVPGRNGLFLAGEEFQAESYPAHLTGIQDAAEEHAMKLPGARTLRCESVDFAGELGADSAQLAFAADYSGCLAEVSESKLPAEVATNSCGYEIEAIGTLGVECAAAEDAIVLRLYLNEEKQLEGTPLCTYEIAEQSGIPGLGLANFGEGEERGVSIDFAVSALTYIKVQGTIGNCGGNVAKTTSYEGTTDVTGSVG